MKHNVSNPKYIQHDRHGRTVWAREDLVGQHVGLCLCYKCSRFRPKGLPSCPIANDTYNNCVLHGLVTPVMECPEFNEKGKKKKYLARLTSFVTVEAETEDEAQKLALQFSHRSAGQVTIEAREDKNK